MHKMMAWLGKKHETKVLHVADMVSGEWVPYYLHPKKEPDYKGTMPSEHGSESKGLATMHKLLKQGWVIDVDANKENL